MTPAEERELVLTLREFRIGLEWILADMLEWLRDRVERAR